MESFWTAVKARMKTQLPDHSFRMWIGPLDVVSKKENHITLSCPNAFSRKRVCDHYLSLLREAFTSAGIQDPVVRIEVPSRQKTRGSGCRSLSGTSDAGSCGPGTDNASGGNGGSEKIQPRRPRQLTLPGLSPSFDTGRMLKKSYTFDRFVVGNSNDFAYTASLSLAQGNPNGQDAIYLLSDTGLGKSHLSQAVGHHAMDRKNGCKVFYVTAEDFTNEMVSSLTNNRINAFKEKYRRRCDVLILEDVHFLSGKAATQKELAMTLDYLLDAEKKLIFSGCYLPGDIPKMNDQLKSRLSMGLVTRIERPDFKTRVRILKKKALLSGIRLPGDVTDFMAQELCDNVRQLESGLKGVCARSSLLGDPINVDLARAVLSTISRRRKQITMEGIKDLVCREFGVSKADLVSPSRKKKHVQPRQIAIYLARKYTDQPIKAIGKSFNRYHATAIYSINAVEKAIRQQGGYARQMAHLTRKIETGRMQG